jgi:hypothetical protein
VYTGDESTGTLLGKLEVDLCSCRLLLFYSAVSLLSHTCSFACLVFVSRQVFTESRSRGLAYAEQVVSIVSRELVFIVGRGLGRT